MDHKNARARASVIRALFLLVATALVAAFGVAAAQATVPRQDDAAPVTATTSSDAAESATSATAASDDRAEPAGTHHVPAATPETVRPLVVQLPAAEPVGAPADAPTVDPTTACGRAPPA